VEGYIKLHRKILESPVVMKTNDHFAVWMFLLLNATHKGYDVLYEGKRKTLQPGQLITGRKIISKALKINESKVQRILKTFKIEQQIEQQTNPRCRIITILNWCDYQQDEQQTKQQVNNKRTLNKKVKNVKNEKKTYNKSVDEEKKKYRKSIDEIDIPSLIDQFPDVDVAHEFEKFKYYLGANEKTYKNYVMAFKNWLSSDWVRRKEVNVLSKIAKEMGLRK